MTGSEAGAQEERLVPSDIVLMFGGRFAETQEDGYRVPCTETQVRFGSLIREVFLTALAYLAAQETIELAVGEKRRLFAKHRTVLIQLKQAPAQPLGGVEGAILASLKGAPSDNPVRDVMSRVAGTTTVDPYSAMAAISMQNACRAGYFEEEERSGTEKILGGKTLPKSFRPRCERIASLAQRLPGVEELREGFRARYAELYDLLASEVERSLRSVYLRT